MFTGPFKYKNALQVYTAGWVALGGIHNWILWSVGFDYGLSAVDSLINNGLLAAECLAISNTLKYYRPGKGRTITLTLWTFALAGICVFISWWALSNIYADNLEYIEFLNESLPVRYAISLLILGWFVMLSWIWYYLQTQQEEGSRKADMEKLAREAELVNLRQQLQPHFLFNSLNSINALIISKPEQARKMTQQLSDFLRGTLKKDEQKRVTFEEELNHLSLYLEIEKVRFGHRLNTNIHSDEASLSMKIPPLLLQPVVENAIKFGLYDTLEPITIDIISKAEAQNLVVIVKNPFDPETAHPKKGTGFGLDSIKRRLYLLFARKDLLHTSVSDNIFTTTIEIPQSI